MLFAQAYTIGQRIFITASMLTKARSGDLSLRFGLAHELGHVVLHGDGIARPRLLDRRYVAGKTEMRS